MRDPSVQQLERRLHLYTLAGMPAWIVMGVSLHALKQPEAALLSALANPLIAWGTLALGIVGALWELARVLPLLRALSAARRDH